MRGGGAARAARRDAERYLAGRARTLSVPADLSLVPDGFGRRVLEATPRSPTASSGPTGTWPAWREPPGGRAAGQRAGSLPDRAVRAVPPGRARERHARRVRPPRGPQAVAPASRGSDRRETGRSSPACERMGSHDPPTPARRARDHAARGRVHGRRRGSGSDRATPPTGAVDASTYSAEVASSDLAVDSPEAVQLGVFSSTADGGVQLLSFGEVDVSFSYLGADGSQEPAAGPATSAVYVPAPTTAADGEGPTLTDPAEARGVYQTPDVTFPQAGVWNATVTADVDGGQRHARGARSPSFRSTVSPLPATRRSPRRTSRSTRRRRRSRSTRAPRTGRRSPTRSCTRPRSPRRSAQGVPPLVQFATPVYCVSRFCGPTVEAQEELAAEYRGVADFIHVEIWRDYDASVVNEAAADWLLRGKDLTEPWLYLIGSRRRHRRPVGTAVRSRRRALVARRPACLSDPSNATAPHRGSVRPPVAWRRPWNSNR